MSWLLWFPVPIELQFHACPFHYLLPCGSYRRHKFVSLFWWAIVPSNENPHLVQFHLPNINFCPKIIDTFASKDLVEAQFLLKCLSFALICFILRDQPLLEQGFWDIFINKHVQGIQFKWLEFSIDGSKYRVLLLLLKGSMGETLRRSDELH